MYRFKDILTAYNDREVIDSLQTHPPVSSLEDQGKCSVTKKVTLTVLKLIHTLHNFSPFTAVSTCMTSGRSNSLSLTSPAHSQFSQYIHRQFPSAIPARLGRPPLEDGHTFRRQKKQTSKNILTSNFCMHHKTTYLLLSSSDLLSPSRYCTVSWPSFKTANSQLCCDLAIARRDRLRLDAIVYVR